MRELPRWATRAILALLVLCVCLAMIGWNVVGGRVGVLLILLAAVVAIGGSTATFIKAANQLDEDS